MVHNNAINPVHEKFIDDPGEWKKLSTNVQFI